VPLAIRNGTVDQLVSVPDGHVARTIHGGPSSVTHAGLQRGVAATSALELPCEFAAKIGIGLPEEVARFIKSGFWPARFESSPVWDPNIPEPGS